MSHEQSTDEVRDRATLYALGVLEPADVAAFEAHLAEGCRTCVGEVQAFRAVAEELAYAAAAVRPGAEVRERLLARVAPEWQRWSSTWRAGRPSGRGRRAPAGAAGEAPRPARGDRAVHRACPDGGRPRLPGPPAC